MDLKPIRLVFTTDDRERIEQALLPASGPMAGAIRRLLADYDTLMSANAERDADDSDTEPVE